MNILAIDPGTEQSGWCSYHAETGVIGAGVKPNDIMLDEIRYSCADVLALEMVASYGMAVGRDVFETVRWIGRFQQTWKRPDDAMLIYRRDIKLHLCNSAKAKDANIRQALLDMFPRTGGGKTPQIGTKAQPGPLYGVASHAWSALALAITCEHQLRAKEAA